MCFAFWFDINSLTRRSIDKIHLRIVTFNLFQHTKKKKFGFNALVLFICETEPELFLLLQTFFSVENYFGYVNNPRKKKFVVVKGIPVQIRC